MISKENIIEPGDSVRAHSGPHAGETGTAIDVIWYDDQGSMHALVRLMSIEGISIFCDMSMLEKVKGDDQPPAREEQKWKISGHEYRK
jgi:ribosomal protein L24